MKNPIPLYLLPLFANTTLACSGEKKQVEPSTPLSEQALEFEIYDSLVVDYLGNLVLMDISPDGNNFLLIDQNTDSIFVTNPEGNVNYRYKKEGDGPEFYQDGIWGNARFLNNSEYLLPTFSGIFQFDLNGILVKKHKLDFIIHSALGVSNNDNFILKDQKFYTNMSGRGVDEFGISGVKYQQKAYQIEILDLQSGRFYPAIRFSKSSKYSNTEKSYSDLEFNRNISSSGDSLFINFRSEPRIFGYPFSDLSSTPSVKEIPFPRFIEKEPSDKNPKENFQYNDLFLGVIDKMISINAKLFLLNYRQGLSKEEFDKIYSDVGGEISKVFKTAENSNTALWVLFDGQLLSSSIYKPELLGNMDKFISQEEIWFSANFEKLENDYSVIYKTRLVQK
jgi:hypothetical protein